MKIIDHILSFSDLKDVDEGAEPAPHQPEILLIACVDARKDPIADLGIPKGKAIIMRNIAALVSHHSVPLNERLIISSTLEFSVKILKVKHIVVMGHTHCGGIKASLTGVDLPSLDLYLRSFLPVDDTLNDENLSLEEKCRHLEEKAVAFSVDNLKSYDFISDAVNNGSLSLHGWVLDTASGKINVVT